MKMTDDIFQIVVGSREKNQKKEFFTQLEHNQQVKEEFQRIKNAWALAASKKEMPEYQLEKLYLNFRERMNIKREILPLKISSYLKYVAIFIFAICISSLFFTRFYSSEKSKSTVQKTSVVTDNGQLSRIILPDSSVVWLNAGTKITYNNDFAISNREITLNGQAFFQVTKNKNIPLKVFCNDIQIRVLGTKFDVSAYPDDNNVRVVLKSGKVEMFNSGAKSFRCELKPGEMAQYNKLSGNMSREEVNVEKFTSWKDGTLIFRDDPMTEVIPQLQRRYNINIEVGDPDIYNSVFTATIRNETLEEIFRSISYACSVNYQIINDDLNDKTKIILIKKSN